ncbi:MAG: hypothetical protein IKP17_06080 [Oscillospiraceae bacterium]|nr:hypothetical protein [Oscillospiraceae bacterium]
MKDDMLLDAVGGIDSRFVEAAAKPGKKRFPRRLAASLAACAVLLVGLTAVWPKLRPAAPQPAPVPNPNGTVERGEEPEVYPFPHVLRPGGEGYTAPEPIPTLNPAPAGISIPAIELPEPGAQADMLGLIVYRGGIYTQAGRYEGEAAERIEALLGDYLGYAAGRIDEWSTQEEYAVEFASSVPGDVYAVKGYDTDFRICIRQEFTYGNGAPGLFVCFYERLNGITLTAGKDLYEERLHVRGHVAAIQWQAHEDWDWNRGNYREAPVSQEDWDAFLDALDAGGFIDAWAPDGSFYEGRPGSTIYDTPNQAHLFLDMDDGTRIELRLIEGGYVRYRILGGGRYFVGMPGEAFDAVFDACGGTHETDW